MGFPVSVHDVLWCVAPLLVFRVVVLGWSTRLSLMSTKAKNVDAIDVYVLVLYVVPLCESCVVARVGLRNLGSIFIEVKLVVGIDVPSDESHVSVESQVVWCSTSRVAWCSTSQGVWF